MWWEENYGNWYEYFTSTVLRIEQSYLSGSNNSIFGSKVEISSRSQRCSRSSLTAGDASTDVYRSSKLFHEVHSVQEGKMDPTKKVGPFEEMFLGSQESARKLVIQFGTE